MANKTIEHPLLGKKAPAFSLKDETGTTRKLSEFKGKRLLLYFYPKDLTPGCTVEAQIFRDKIKDFKKLNTEILGVSCDDVETHVKFIERHKLNFSLLADTDKKLVEKFKVWVEKNMYGKKYMGIQRDSFLIDENGVIIKYYKKVKPKEHAAEVLKDLKAL